MDRSEMFERQPEAFEIPQRPEDDYVTVPLCGEDHDVFYKVTNYTPASSTPEEAHGVIVQHPESSEIELDITAIWNNETGRLLTDADTKCVKNNDNFMRRIEDAAEIAYLEDDGYDG